MSDSILNSESLHEGLHSGHDEAFIILWREGFKLVFACYVRLGLVDEAEDLWSETFIKLLGGTYSTYDPRKCPFECWLMKVSRNVALDLIRKRRRQVSLEACANLASPEPNLEEKEGGSHELKVLIKRAEASLGPNDRTIISLRVVEGLSHKLIADELRISESAVAMRVLRATERLWIEMKGLSPRELPRRIRRSARRYPARVVPPPY
jgi:RNA polymerase sigma factor (sigma-70 family)